jgi:hypothetical protein
MQIEPEVRRSIIRNIGLSLAIYALPIVLMFGTFYVRGERPWAKSHTSNSSAQKSYAAHGGGND